MWRFSSRNGRHWNDARTAEKVAFGRMLHVKHRPLDESGFSTVVYWRFSRISPDREKKYTGMQTP